MPPGWLLNWERSSRCLPLRLLWHNSLRLYSSNTCLHAQPLLLDLHLQQAVSKSEVV